jgi:phospholipase/carboxylesterase
LSGAGIEGYHSVEDGPAGGPVIFTFHGTGGDELQFHALAAELMPGARRVGIRGDVSEGGALRYFRRLGEGRYDMDDLARATGKMAAFLSARIGPERPPLVAALGYSNGANILASVLFNTPELVDRAVLMHPLIPFAPPMQAGLAGRKVLITAGRMDPIAPAAATQALADYFGGQGASVTMHWHEGGHEIRRDELVAAQRFLA